ncbi:MAG: hypothetical protein IJO48_03920, partial [Clostridia bacterium]|nr:hypothetical protein [Clostridia bacterium]
MFYNHFMEKNNEKSNNRKDAVKSGFKRIKTPLIASASVAVVGLLIIPPILSATSAGENFFASALNINAPNVFDSSPLPSSVVIVPQTTTAAPTIKPPST